MHWATVQILWHLFLSTWQLFRHGSTIFIPTSELLEWSIFFSWLEWHFQQDQSLFKQNKHYWVNSSSICKSQTFAFVLRKKAAQTCISANAHTPLYWYSMLSWSQLSVVNRFWLTGKCLIWSLNFYFWLTSIWKLWSFSLWSGKMDGQGLGYSPVCFTKPVFDVLFHNLYLMSFLIIYI